MPKNIQKTNYVVFILTHGRPENVITYDTLMKQGFKWKIYFVIDDEDIKWDEYIAKFGKENVIKFSKEEVAKTFDTFDNSDNRKTIVYARNACFDIAKKLWVRYFIQLDDDYTRFEYVFTNDDKFCHKVTNSLDEIFEAMFKYFKSINALSIAMSQWWDFLGGAKWGFANSVNRKRKCMNSFFCDTERPFKFFWRINEDVNTYTTLGSRWNLFLTIPLISLIQNQTQSSAWGMTDVYKAWGTYLKSFFSVISCPSSVKIAEMWSKHRRIHHKVNWERTNPKIIREEFLKK